MCCKWCGIKVDTWADQIKAHLERKRHLRLKQEGENRNKQTLESAFIQAQQKERDQHDVLSEFICAVCFSEPLLGLADGPLHEISVQLQNPCQIQSINLIKKYLEENDVALTNKIKERLTGNIVSSLIFDESPNVLDRGDLFSFFYFIVEKLALILADLEFVKSANSQTVAASVSKTLSEYAHTWKDVATVNSDSASYSGKFTQDVKLNEKPELLHLSCPAHLLHVAVSPATGVPKMDDFKKFVTC
ncbi:hypothetical protein UY3_17836 [Chelonia mydas]|uniref:DUF4371 domain-containing protein n=1 Tax=Chelonia mydas TaxID=8469 RepID=M7AQQ5_CHEMY|nr:hypothetical protein UY3_17836 [Chelonia mydas]